MTGTVEKSRAFPARPMPSDMIDLIEEYENGLQGRLSAIVNELVQALNVDRRDVQRLMLLRHASAVSTPR